MKILPYAKRSRKEMKAAGRWAIEKLQLQNYTVSQYIDEITPLEELNTIYESPDIEAKVSACSLISRRRLTFTIAVNTNTCKKINEEPLISIFHEFSHAITHMQHFMGVEDGDLYDEEWELISNRIAYLLYWLYEAEGLLDSS